MKTNFIRFKREKEPPYTWECTEEEFNTTMQAIGNFSQVIDLRDDIGQIFSFTHFDGSGELPKKPEYYYALPEPALTEEQRRHRQLRRKQWERKWAEKYPDNQFFKKLIAKHS